MAVVQGDASRHFLRLSDRYDKLAGFLSETARSGVKKPEGLSNIAVQNAAMAVERAFKAMILAHTPPRLRDEEVGSFRGSRAHDPEWLKDHLRSRAVTIPRSVNQTVSRMSWWDHDQRYDLSIVPLAKAADFIVDSRVIIDWIKGGI